MIKAILILLIGILSFAVGFRFNPIRRASSALCSIKIKPGEDEPIENILRRFKKAVGQSGHLTELRFKEFWENAHDKKKRKRERVMVLNKIERTNDKYEKRNDGEGEYNS